MANQREFMKAKRVSAVIEMKDYKALQHRADRMGITISKYICRVLTQLARGPGARAKAT